MSCKNFHSCSRGHVMPKIFQPTTKSSNAGLRVVIVRGFESIVRRTPNSPSTGLRVIISCEVVSLAARTLKLADASLKYFTVLLVRCLKKFSLMQQGSCDALNILIQRTLRRSMNRGRYCAKSLRPWFTRNVEVSAPYMFPWCVTKEYSFASRAPLTKFWCVLYEVLM